MADPPSTPRVGARPSPLDPFLGDFLRVVGDLATGYASAADRRLVTASLDWPPAFADAIFTSARCRRMIEPCRTPGARNRSRWCLSARGQDWLAELSRTLAAMPPTDESPQP